MTHMRLKLIVAGVALAAALGYLALAGVKKGWTYYLDVDAFAADTQYQTQRVRLAGAVSPDGLDLTKGALTTKFTLIGKQSKLPVVYRGSLPDMFKADAQVVVEGQMDAAGVFVADSLMTKCASKYASEKPAEHPGSPGTPGAPGIPDQSK